MGSREQFEIWAYRKAVKAGYAHLCIVLAKHEDGAYRTTWVDSAWLGWQASREAIEIELPEVKDLEIVEVGCTYEDSFVYYLDVVRAIEDAGLKVKPC